MALFSVPPFLFIYPASIKAIVPIWYKPANPYSFISLWFPEDSLAPNAPKYLNISSLLNPLTDPFPVNVDEILCAILAKLLSFLLRFPVLDVAGVFFELESLVLIAANPPGEVFVLDGEYPFAVNLTSPPFQ